MASGAPETAINGVAASPFDANSLLNEAGNCFDGTANVSVITGNFMGQNREYTREMSTLGHKRTNASQKGISLYRLKRT
jgi:hypothetical protein